jgi:glyoxylase-like metal-dependent hydrolase (beta-lactamase superfamily II)
MDGLQAVNVYLLTHGDRATLVDSGWAIPEARERLVAALDVLSMQPSDIDRFLITHVHRDHYEQSLSIRREFGTSIALGRDEERTLDYVVGREIPGIELQLARLRELGASVLAQNLDGAPKEHSPQVEYPDEWLDEGEISVGGSRLLEVIATPGHTRGHVVFRDSRSMSLFAGDHILPNITPSIGFERPLSQNPLGDFLESLAKVRSLPDTRLLPAHGPISQSTHQRIDELVDHHGQRLEECAASLLAGCTTGFEVANRLSWTRHSRRLTELDPFNAMLAVTETGAHLALLVAQDRAREKCEDGVRHFFAS